MGATTFYEWAVGKTAQEAFNNAVKEAQYEHGHGGYTGTIAEKRSFVQIPLPEGMEPDVYADQLIEKGDRRVDDKWGPAGCFDLGIKDGHRMWFFFGWASE